MSRRGLRLLVTTFVVLCCGLVVAPPASAEPVGRILDVREDEEGNLRVIFGAEDVDEGVAIDKGSMLAQLDGETLAVSSQFVGESVDVGRRVAVLAVDVSGSMRGPGITAARAAARAFLDQVPDDVLVGLVTFSDKAAIRVRPTRERVQLRKVIARLQADGGTALYDATVRAVSLTGTEGVRSVIVLSDGADDGSSRNTRRSAIARIRGTKVAVDAVSLGTSASQVSSLQALTKAGGGSVVTTSRASDLVGLFAEAAKALENQLVITVSVPDRLAGKGGNLTISGTAAGATLTDTAFARTTPRETKVPAPAPRKDFGPKPAQQPAVAKLADRRVLSVAIGGIFVGLLFLLLVAVNATGSGDGRSGRVRRRLDMYTLTGKGGAAKQQEEQSSQVLGSGAVARSAMELAGRVAAKRGLEQKLGRKLEAGGIPLKPAEWLLIHGGAIIVSALVLFLLFGGSPLWALFGVIVGALVPYAYLVIKDARRKKAFSAQLPDSLQLLSGSLSAGYSLPQAVDTLVREGQQPLAAELNRVLIESRLGAPIEDALEGVAERMSSDDFSWVVMAIRIQREVGGNLAEVLATVSKTLREREALRRHVRALSAEGVISAWILCGLPPGFVLFLAVARPGYLEPLISDFFGWTLLGLSVVLMAVGIVWMRSVIKVKI